MADPIIFMPPPSILYLFSASSSAALLFTPLGATSCIASTATALLLLVATARNTIPGKAAAELLLFFSQQQRIDLPFLSARFEASLFSSDDVDGFSEVKTLRASASDRSESSMILLRDVSICTVCFWRNDLNEGERKSSIYWEMLID